MGLWARIRGQKLAMPIADPRTGEIIAEAGEVLTTERAHQLDEFSGEELKDAIRDRIDDLIPKHITVPDIMASINYLNCLAHHVGTPDDIDHLGNRRLRCVGELIQNQFRIGFSRMERVIRERMTTQDLDVVTPQSLINIRPVTAPCPSSWTRPTPWPS